MTWPPRISLPSSCAAVLAASSSQWRLDDLECAEAQQHALSHACDRAPLLRAVLDAATTAVRHSGAVLVEGFPPEGVALVVFASTLGEVNPTYNGPAPGRLVHELIAAAPYRRDADPLHTDSVFIDRQHAYIGLVCVQPSPTSDGQTVLMRAVDIASALDGQGNHLRLLQDTCYPFAEPPPKERGAGPPVVHFGSIMHVADEDATVRFRPTRVRAGLRLKPQALDIDHLAALHAFEAILRLPHLTTVILLRAGDLLLLDNRRILHGRTAIEPGGGVRHLKRVKVHA